jgi:Cys-rich repeat protein
MKHIFNLKSWFYTVSFCSGAMLFLLFSTGSSIAQCTSDASCPAGTVCINGNCIVLTPRQTPVEAAPSAAPVVAPTPAPAPAPALEPTNSQMLGGCGKDSDCKGDRICDHGQCVEPTSRTNMGTSPQSVAIVAVVPSPVASTDPVVRLSPRFGFNFTWGTGSNFDTLSELGDSAELYWGFRWGVGAEFFSSKPFSIEPCIYLEQKGAAILNGGVNSDFVIRCLYLSFPFNARFNIVNTKEFGFTLYGGPTLSFLLDTKAYVGKTYTDLGNDTHLNSVFFSLHPGVGISFSGVEIDAEFTLGLTNIFDNRNIGGNTLSIEGTYNIPIGGK